VIPLLPVLLATSMAVGACPNSPKAKIDVVGTHGPVPIHADLSLADLEQMAKKSGRTENHPPLGFYYGQFSYTLSIGVEGGLPVCEALVHITVIMRLTHRTIEIARDLVATPCRYEAALAHYERHAAWDDAILSRYVGAVLRSLNTAPIPPLEENAAAEENRNRIETHVRSVVERSLEFLTQEREAARDRVDTPDEVKRLAETCSSPASTSNLVPHT
jgi:hypothetical protein